MRTLGYLCRSFVKAKKKSTVRIFLFISIPLASGGVILIIFSHAAPASDFYYYCPERNPLEQHLYHGLIHRSDDQLVSNGIKSSYEESNKGHWGKNDELPREQVKVKNSDGQVIQDKNLYLKEPEAIGVRRLVQASLNDSFSNVSYRNSQHHHMAESANREYSDQSGYVRDHTKKTLTGDVVSGGNKYLHAEGRSVHNGKWYVLREPFDLYIYSAFYDDRTSLLKTPQLRLIAVGDRRRSEETTVYCHVRYSTVRADRAYVTIATQYLVGVGVKIAGRHLAEYIYSCPLSGVSRCGLPLSVTLGPRTLNQLAVWIPVEVPPRTDNPEYLAVCVSISYSNVDRRTLVEWLEMQRILGIDRVVMYNHSLADNVGHVLGAYKEFVDVRQSHGFLADDGLDDADMRSIYLHMSPVINDCMYRYMHLFRYFVVIDLDELIVPRAEENLAEFIERLPETLGVKPGARIGAYVFRNAYFFLDIPLDTSEYTNVAVGNDVTVSSVYLRHRKRLPVSPPQYSVKSVVDAGACIAMHNHYCWVFTDAALRQWKTERTIEPRLALLHHYKLCHMDAWEQVDGKCRKLFESAVHDQVMLKYRNNLLGRLERRLKELQL